jgi:hypothetical protein
MQLSTALAVDLEQLTAALEAAPRHRLDLTRSLRSLAQNAERAVTSYLGLSITLTFDGQDVTLTSLINGVEQGDVRSSLRVPLDTISPELTGTVVLYASRPDAFLELAAELGGAPVAGGAPGPGGEPLVSGVVGARELSSLNRAVGVLIGRGYAPEDAKRELADRAERDGVPVHLAADRLLAEADGPAFPG